MKYFNWCLGLLLSMVLSGAAAAPQAFRATYDVVKGGIALGGMTAVLDYSANGYTYQKLTKANGLAALLSGDTLLERSVGQKQGVRLLPKSYLHHHKNRRKDKSDEFQFITPLLIQGRYEGNSYQLQAPAGTLDPALMELYLMDGLAVNSSLNYKVSEKGKLKDYRFRRLGGEMVDVPAGEYRCEKVQVVHSDSAERQTVLWLAKDLNYAIVKVRHSEKGDVIETRLRHYQPL